MDRERASAGRRIKVRSQHKSADIFQARRSWEARISGTRKTALTGFLVGMTLGALFGAAMTMMPGGSKPEQPEMLSVNQRTGKPQLHIKGKPEIK